MAKQKITGNQLDNQVAFSAYNPNATGTAIPQTVFTKVDFTTEDFDTHGWYSGSRFTPLLPGKYLLSTFVGLLSVGDQGTVHVAIYKNGTQHRWMRVRQSGTGECGGGLSVVVDANGTTDYFEVYVYQSTAPTNISGSNVNCWFNGTKV